MGIKNLNKTIKKEAPNAIEKVEFTSLKGKVIAIDTSIFLYKFSYFQPNFIKLFWFQVKRFIDNGIIPVYVFDGAPPDAKSDTLTERKERKEQLDNKITELKDTIEKLNTERETLKKKLKDDKTVAKQIEEIDNNIMLNKHEIKAKEKINIKINSKKTRHLKKMFIEMNVPYITSCTEAEKLAAYLYKEGIVDGVLSEDTDLLPQGIGHVYRDYSLNNYYLTHISLDKVLEEMKFTYEQFVDFCILCGCDYTCTLSKIGPATALSMIKKCNNIEGLLKEKKMCCPNDFKYEEARKLFSDISEITASNTVMKKVATLIEYLEEDKDDLSKIKTDIDIKEYVESFPL